MDTTANFGFPKPAYDASGAANASTFANQMDTADSGIYNAIAAKVNASIGTNKGDLLVFTTSGTVVRKALGSDGQYLKVSTAATDGLSYDDPVDWTQGTHGQFLKRDTSATDGYSFDVPVGAGDMVGPASATDRAISLFDGTGGKTLQNSLATIDTAGSINIPSGQTYDIDGSAHAHAGMASGPSTNTDNAIARWDGADSKTLQDSLVTIDDSGSVDLPSGQTYKIGGYVHYPEYHFHQPSNLEDDGYRGICFKVQAGEALTQWDMVYQSLVDGKFYKAKADSATTCPAYGVAVEAANADGLFWILVNGMYRDDGGATLAVGQIIYLSAATAGAITGTMPATSTNQVQHLGWAVTAQIRVININTVTAEVP